MLDIQEVNNMTLLSVLVHGQNMLVHADTLDPVYVTDTTEPLGRIYPTRTYGGRDTQPAKLTNGNPVLLGSNLERIQVPGTELTISRIESISYRDNKPHAYGALLSNGEYTELDLDTFALQEDK